MVVSLLLAFLLRLRDALELGCFWCCDGRQLFHQVLNFGKLIVRGDGMKQLVLLGVILVASGRDLLAVWASIWLGSSSNNSLDVLSEHHGKNRLMLALSRTMK